VTTTEEILQKISQRTSVLNKFLAIAVPIGTVIAGGIWYFNNVWHPKIKLDSVDYEKNVATLTINGKTRVLYAGSTINAGWGWGVRFSGIQTDTYDRVEIVKNELTYKTISTK